MLVLAVLALVVPALSYAALIYLLDLHEREPAWALGSCFALGAAAAPLALFLERQLLASHLPIAQLPDALRLQWSCFGVIAPVEELLKLTVTLLFARRALMNEPVDGVVYAGFAALGFAAGEGLLGASNLSAGALLLRALLPLPGHVFFSALWGAGVGATRYWGRRAAPHAVCAVLAAILLHGAYDYLLVVDRGAQRGAVVALLSAAFVVCALLFRALLSASPFRGVTSRNGECGACQRPYRPLARFCAGCGELLVPLRDARPPLELGAALACFVLHGLSLLTGTLLLSAMRNADPQALWSAALDFGSRAAMWMLLFVGLVAMLPSLLVPRVLPSTRRLDVLVGVAFSWLATLLYLTLSAPEQMARALWLLPLSLFASAASFRGSLRRPDER